MQRVQLLFSPYLRLVATVALPVLGFAAERTTIGVWVGIGLCVLVILAPEFSGDRWRGESTTEYKAVLGRALNLLADLGNLTGGKCDRWVVDLYLPRRSYLTWRPTRHGNLRLAVRVALTGAPAQVTEVREDEPVIGKCYANGRRVLWWDAALAPSTEENCWHSLDESVNAQFARSDYGVMSVHPVTNNVGAERRGVLVVHAEHDAEVTTNVLGALQQQEGKRRIATACEDIFNHLRDW